MKKSLLVVILFTCFNIASATVDDMIILGAEDNGKKHVRINGIVEDCEVTLNSDGAITKTDCLILTNSKKIKILCTKKKKCVRHIIKFMML